ncbi:unnamed protein product [Periconia digitata]|uniref:Uncharacterized protein n=1 Tax=Periconia digitata TaxID=1303443 RepID=A0A9W4UQR1_9PLEO|nr:unnamed protein product [Periconia digitata]
MQLSPPHKVNALPFNHSPNNCQFQHGPLGGLILFAHQTFFLREYVIVAVASFICTSYSPDFPIVSPASIPVTVDNRDAHVLRHTVRGIITVLSMTAKIVHVCLLVLRDMIRSQQDSLTSNAWSIIYLVRLNSAT